MKILLLVGIFGGLVVIRVVALLFSAWRRERRARPMAVHPLRRLRR